MHSLNDETLHTVDAHHSHVDGHDLRFQQLAMLLLGSPLPDEGSDRVVFIFEHHEGHAADGFCRWRIRASLAKLTRLPLSALADRLSIFALAAR